MAAPLATEPLAVYSDWLDGTLRGPPAYMFIYLFIRSFIYGIFEEMVQTHLGNCSLSTPFQAIRIVLRRFCALIGAHQSTPYLRTSAELSELLQSP
jgi:hypothetical protein